MRKQKAKGRLLPAAILIMFSPSVYAGGLFLCADNNAEPTDTVGKELGTLTVSASRTASPTASAIPVQSIDRDKMRTSGITDISDALRRMAGVTLRDYGGEGGMKTLSLRGLGSQHTGVLYDGVALSDVQSGQIDLARYSLGSIAGLTVNHGDANDIFLPARAAASAATLSITTLRAPSMLDENLQLTAGIKTGAFGYIAPSLYIGKSIGEKVSISASGDFTHSDNNFPFTIHNGPLTKREKRKDSDLNSGHGEINAAIATNPSGTLRLKFYGYGKKQHLPGPVILYSPPNNEKLSEGNFFGQVQYKTRLSDKWSLMANAKFNWAKTHYTDINTIYPDGRLDNRYIQREAYLSAAALYRPIRGLSFSYAADWFFNNMNRNITNDPKPRRNTVLQALAVKWQVWRLMLTGKGLLSLVYNSDADGKGGKKAQRLSPSISASIQPMEKVDFHVRASYKNIFRMPTFSELYFDHKGSINLKPEITDQINVGMTYGSPKGRIWDVTVTADGYMNLVRNKIVAMPYNMFVMTMTNLDKVRVLGADVTLNAGIVPWDKQKIILDATWSYQRAATRSSRDRLDWNKQVAYTPLNSGAVSLSWDNPWVSVSIHGTGCSARYATNLNIPSSRISGYFECGAAIWHTFRFHGHSLELRADLINALDKEYELVNAYPMPGRSWQASVTFNL